MRVDAFDFTLPEELIALRPARPRSDAQLVVAGEGDLIFDRFRSLADHLRAGDILVFNDTKVIPARLSGIRRRGEAEAKIEATLIERKDDARWVVFAKPGKRLKPGDVIAFGDLAAEVEAKGEGGAVTLAFDQAGPALDAAIAAVGAPPLPPYIAARRAIDAEDEADYQTRFARRPGAVAAPTASLHFDDLVMERLAAQGVRQATLTLHVGAGTFSPVSAERTEDHKMHAEWGEIDAETAEAIMAARADGGRVIAAGTTALRVLETAAAAGRLSAWRGETSIFITPGYRFQAVDGLITNFHLPRSTLFMLVSAFIGLDRAQALYAEAIRRRMRFYSYGDGSLLWRADHR